RDAGHAHEQPVLDERQVVAPLELEAIEVAVRGLDESAPAAGGLLRNHADRTAEAVLAEERALRAAQHLDALDVHQVEGRTEERAVVDVVDVYADARLEREQQVLLSHAPDLDGRCTGICGMGRPDV